MRRGGEEERGVRRGGEEGGGEEVREVRRGGEEEGGEEGG